MHSQSIFRSIVVSLAISIRLIGAQQDDRQQLFLNCGGRFYSCGSSIRDVGYPFWGGDRPRECGDHLFELRCAPENQTTTIDINGRAFLVYGFDTAGSSIRLARLDLLDDFCPDRFEKTRLDPLLRYTRDVEELTLFYGCPLINISEWEWEWEKMSFRCGSGNKLGYVTDGSFLRVPMVRERMAAVCEGNINVPVLSGAMEEFSRNETTMEEMVRRGFEVEYQMNGAYCATCERSGGLCWSTNANATCLCRDGRSRSVCPVSGKDASRKILLIVGVTIAALATTSIALFLLIWKKHTLLILLRLGKETPRLNEKDIEVFLRNNGNLAPRRYRHSDLKKMTKSFCENLGKGGYGSVYKGKLPDGRLVAVKILNESKGNGEEFMNEIGSISRTSHVNIVTLLGFCFEGSRRALIYEFMPNGSLEKFIHNPSSSTAENQLGWEKLYEIVVGIARGLDYLHQGCNMRIVHFDIKPHNILLDKDFNPKISDFGLAKLCPNRSSIVSMLVARGTIGYIAPEVFYGTFGGVSHKSDVYSYGMMVLEIAGGKKNINPRDVAQSSELYFPQYIYKQLENTDAENLVNVDENENQFVKRKLLIVGLWCIQTDPKDRPSMSKVVDMLEGKIEPLQVPPKPYTSSPPRSPKSSWISETI